MAEPVARQGAATARLSERQALRERTAPNSQPVAANYHYTYSSRDRTFCHSAQDTESVTLAPVPIGTRHGLAGERARTGDGGHRAGRLQ
jgi:hypothetical protein